jgi:hypothetical protein
MIVDDKYKFVFQHVPKTGGTFLVNILTHYLNTCMNMNTYSLRWYTDEETNSFIQEKLKTRPGFAAHMEFRQLSQDVIENYKLMISIRHPMDRIISLYSDLFFNNFTFNENARRSPPLDMRTFLEKSTRGFDPERSISRQIENALATSREYQGYQILKFESLKYDLLRALSVFKVPVGEMFFRDLMVNGGTTDIVSGRANIWRKTPSDTKKMVQEFLYADKPLCKKFYEYENWTIEKFYTPRLQEE